MCRGRGKQGGKQGGRFQGRLYPFSICVGEAPKMHLPLFTLLLFHARHDSCFQLSSSNIRCFGRSISSNWPVFTAQRKMNQAARPTANMRTMSAMIVQSIFYGVWLQPRCRFRLAATPFVIFRCGRERNGGQQQPLRQRQWCAFQKRHVRSPILFLCGPDRRTSLPVRPGSPATRHFPG